MAVFCLCAAWCDTCTAFRPAFDALAHARPDLAFGWFDVEDDEGMVEDVDVDNFPTLVIQRGTTILFSGPIDPRPGVFERLVASVAGRDPAA